MKKILAVLIVLAWSSPLHGQGAELVGIQAGTRVRIATDGPKVVGSFVRATPDSLHLLDQQGHPQTFTAKRISSMDVSVGRPVRSGRVAKGVLLGTAIVGAAGAAAIAAGGDGGNGDEGYAWMAVALLAPISGIVGGIWAARTAPEEWQSVPVATLSANASRSQAATVPMIRRSKGNGKRIGVGALVGGVAGALFATTQRSSAPMAGRLMVPIVPGILAGGAIGALMH